MALAGVVTVAAVVVWAAAWVLGVRVQYWLTPRPEPLMHAACVDAQPGPMLDVAKAARGRDIFVRTCTTCHGPAGTGVAGLGKDLVHSDLVHGLGDEELAAFIEHGREASDPKNTTKMPMPAKGGVEGLTREDMRAVAVYLRGVQDPRRVPQLPAIAPVVVALAMAPGPDEKAAIPGDEASELAAAIARGKRMFASSCSACHGPDAKGLPKLGKNLVASEWLGKQSDENLMAFIKRGRDPSDPLNTTKVAMPPKGGNPALNDDQLWDIIDFVRSLQGSAGQASNVSSKN